MKKLMTGLVLSVVCLIPWVCQAQYYYYYPGYGYYYAPQPLLPPGAYRPPAPQRPGAVPPTTTLYQRWMPDPKMIQRWNQHNRMSDYYEMQRSPLDRESDLDYMLRTF
jgi:hypothetical protein